MITEGVINDVPSHEMPSNGFAKVFAPIPTW
jgi:hypothetical protein